MTPAWDTILLVEDNDDDVFIFRRAYRQAQLPHAVQSASDGKEAVEYLQGEGRFADRAAFPLPFLVLLDLKLPVKNGLEVLQAIRARPELARVSVIVLTSSAEERDIARARELGARAFLVKPPKPATLSEAITVVRRELAGGEAARAPIAGDMLAPGAT